MHVCALIQTSVCTDLLKKMVNTDSDISVKYTNNPSSHLYPTNIFQKFNFYINNLCN